MAATDPFYLDPPTEEDLAVALDAWREGRLRRELDVGTRWYRILRARSAEEAAQFAEVCYPSDANNRFSPLRKWGAIFPAAYAGKTPETAAWEVVLRDIRHQGSRRVPQHQTRDRYLIETRLSRPRAVLDIRRPQIENLVTAGKHSPNLSGAPDYLYDRTRHWAQVLLHRITEIEGILYESHQVPTDCLVLFADTKATVFIPEGRADPRHAQP
jgi:hypothetical protein